MHAEANAQGELGHYAKKQLCSPSWLIAWSHGARFRMAVELVSQLHPITVLDYGCGDGTFLELLMRNAGAPQAAMGVDVDSGQIDDCRRRIADPRLSFATVASLATGDARCDVDVLICMEVLEHIVDLAPVLDSWARLVRPNGTIIVSVPVEIGPALLMKQAMRRIAGWRGIGDYPGMAPYTWGELCRSVLAGRAQHLPRPVHRSSEGSEGHCHKAFNWRVVERMLRERFTLRKRITTPWRWMPPGLSSQVWFQLTV